MARIFACLLTLSFLFVSLNSASAQDRMGGRKAVMEPKTEIVFPVRLPVLGGTTHHTLTGVGVRTKTIFNVKVYAMGLYVDGRHAAAALEPWKTKTSKSLKKDKKFYQAILNKEFDKTLRLVLARDVDGEDMQEAFEDSIEPRMKLAAKARKENAGKAALNKFKTYFNVDELVEGTVLVFSWHEKGTLVTSMNGKELGRIDSEALCWSLFDIYLGEDPISKRAKEEFGAGFPKILKADYPPEESTQAVQGALGNLGGTEKGGR